MTVSTHAHTAVLPSGLVLVCSGARSKVSYNTFDRGHSSFMSQESLMLEDGRNGHAKSAFGLSSSMSVRTVLITGFTLVVATLIVVGVVLVYALSPSSPTSSNGLPTLQSAEFIATCLSSHKTTKTGVNVPPRAFDASISPILIRNGTVYDGRGNTYLNHDVLLNGGLIAQIGQGLSAAGAVVYDAQGRFVTPGIVDMHSHVGLSNWIALSGNSDTNEATNPTTPQVRAIDAFNPSDPAIGIIRSGGVTTSQVLPGSANTMGGEGFLIKMKDSYYFSDIVIPNAPRILKMACGENPRRVYGSRTQMPQTRMGAAWVMRQRFEAAQKLIAAQKSWCAAGAEATNTPWPSDLSLDAVVALLQGDALLQNHCYLPTDFQMMMRLADEFNFTITAFHHGLSAYRITNLLKNITIATFADHGMFKQEGFDATVSQPALLAAAGVPYAIKSDHPVLNAQYMAFEMAKTVHWAVDVQQALKSVTSTPAAALGLSQRVGALAENMDADVVIWDRDIVQLGAMPTHVFIDGALVFNKTYVPPPVPLSTPGAINSNSCPIVQDLLTNISSCYAFSNVMIYQMDQVNNVYAGGNVVVQGGIITCVNTADYCTIPSQCAVFSQDQGYVTPSFIESGSHLGQLELPSESSTQDGTQDGSGVDGSYGQINAFEGIHMRTRHMSSAWAAGIGAAVSPPQMGRQLVAGVATAFQTCCGVTVNSTVIQQRVSLHLALGNSAKSSGLPASISGQVAALRLLFTNARAALNSTTAVPVWQTPFVQALQNQLPVSVEVDSADEISALLRLQAQFGFNVVIYGGAEAWLLASELGAINAGVILHSRQPPSTYETLRANPKNAAILTAAGVTVGVSTLDLDMVRGLRWDAGWAIEAGLSEQQAVATITKNIVNMFQISPANGGTQWSAGIGTIQVGTPARLNLFNGPPLSLQSQVIATTMGDQVQCLPKQWQQI